MQAMKNWLTGAMEPEKKAGGEYVYHSSSDHESDEVAALPPMKKKLVDIDDEEDSGISTGVSYSRADSSNYMRDS